MSFASLFMFSLDSSDFIVVGPFVEVRLFLFSRERYIMFVYLFRAVVHLRFIFDKKGSEAFFFLNRGHTI